jgi:hypothetical protein
MCLEVIDMITRRSITIAAVGILGILGLASAALFYGSANEGKQMNPAPGAIPPIDISASARTETATFALG